MPVLPDPKREQFAQLCARGIPTIDAYTRAGYKRNTGNATALKKSTNVAARIDELQKEMSGDTMQELNEYIRDSQMSPTYIIKKLRETAEQAMEAGKFDVASKIIKDIGGELFGMFIQKQPTTNKDSSVFTETTQPVDITRLNTALEGLGNGRPRIAQEAPVVPVIDVAGNLLSGDPLKGK